MMENRVYEEKQENERYSFQWITGRSTAEGGVSVNEWPFSKSYPVRNQLAQSVDNIGITADIGGAI